MKTKIRIASLILGLGLITAVSANAQRYITKNGTITFYSEAPMENIEAVNQQVNAALDISSGDMVFKVLMKSFEFEKALMQEHFNENYVESHKYPNATFKGKVVNMDEVDFTKPGTYTAILEGNLTIHGVTNPVKHEGIFEVKGNEIHGDSKFMIALAGYDIEIPNAVVNKISETIEVTVDVDMKKLD